MTWRALSDAVTNALSTMPLRAVLRLALVLVPAAMPSESAVGVSDLVDSPSTASYTNKEHKLAIDQGPLYVFLAFDKVWASTSVRVDKHHADHFYNSTPQHHPTMTTCPITNSPRHQFAASPLSPHHHFSRANQVGSTSLRVVLGELLERRRSESDGEGQVSQFHSSHLIVPVCHSAPFVTARRLSHPTRRSLVSRPRSVCRRTRWKSEDTLLRPLGEPHVVVGECMVRMELPRRASRQLHPRRRDGRHRLQLRRDLKAVRHVHHPPQPNLPRALWLLVLLQGV